MAASPARRTAAALLGTPVGIGISTLRSELIARIEIVVALTLIAVALFGNQALSERAFRLLARSEPSPAAPPGDNPLNHSVFCLLALPGRLWRR